MRGRHIGALCGRRGLRDRRCARRRGRAAHEARAVFLWVGVEKAHAAVPHGPQPGMGAQCGERSWAFELQSLGTCQPQGSGCACRAAGGARRSFAPRAWCCGTCGGLSHRWLAGEARTVPSFLARCHTNLTTRALREQRAREPRVRGREGARRGCEGGRRNGRCVAARSRDEPLAPSPVGNSGLLSLASPGRQGRRRRSPTRQPAVTLRWPI